jgi:hypothetical protein
LTAGADAALAADGRSVRTLHDDGQVVIELHECHPPSRTLVVTFDPLMYLWPKAGFGLEFLSRQAVDVITVRRRAEDFYQSLDRETFRRVVDPLVQERLRVVLYGSSLGAYAALYFGRDLDCEVIAASPRVSIHPVYGTKGWQDQVQFRHRRFDRARPARCRAIVLFDPREPTDRRYIEGDVLPQFAQAQAVRIPFAGHPCTQFLGDIGFIAPFVRAVVTGQAAPALDRRQRVRSATYFRVLAALCTQHGHLVWALALIDRSLALRDIDMLAHRTRGLVKTLQRDWAEAVASLERALEFDPADPLTQSMLEKARTGLEAARLARPPERYGPQAHPPPAAPPQAAPASTLAGRALRWLRGDH